MFALISVLTALLFAPQDMILHRAPVEYPPAAKQKAIQGSVTVEVDLDAEGLVTDARVLSGPQELRNAALRSVLRWHWSKQMQLPATTQVTVEFKLTDRTVGAEPYAMNAPLKSFASNRMVRNIIVADVTDGARDALLARLPVRQGDVLTEQTIDRLVEEVRVFDEHLRLNATSLPDNGVLLEISSRPAAAAPPSRIRVGGNVQQAMLTQQPKPIYPAETKAQRIQGTVRLGAIINRDGTVQTLDLLAGDPLLADAAMSAVKQWVYKPTLLNGEPVEVATEIAVNFTLSR
jgi:TonB family protein